MSTVRPRVREYDVTVDEDRAAHSVLGGSPLPREDEWLAEHYVLAGLVRCTLASMDHEAGRAGVNAVGGGSAHGVVTKREDDGRYAFVEIDTTLEIRLTPALQRDALEPFLDRTERGCFVGNSLVARPHYRWIVNGEEVR